MPGSIYDSDQQPALIKFMTDAMVKMEMRSRNHWRISLRNYRSEKGRYSLGDLVNSLEGERCTKELFLNLTY